MSFLLDNIHLLDEKKPQTTNKIEYVTKYVENWLYVVTNVDQNKNINFVDCMCNAGIYTDGEKGTAIKVLELFNEFAWKHTDKTFNLILNDINLERLNVITTIIYEHIGINAPNIQVITRNMDVNDFLSDLQFINQYFSCYPKRSANLVFVDPYNFCTVKVSLLEKLLSKFYCELLFNIFTNDYVRNKNTEKMKKFCEEEKIPSASKYEMIRHIANQLKVGSVKYSFAYEFKTVTNAEIYQIMFFTPSVRGLEKLKDALWDTFGGKEFYRNPNETDAGQMEFLSEAEAKTMLIEKYAFEAKELLLDILDPMNETNYITIESYIIENTMLQSGQVLNYVLKPLIKEGKIRKLGQVARSNNYKDDKYVIGVLKNEN